MAAQIYEFRVQGSPDQAWARQFEEIEIMPLENGEFLLRAAILDQPALHGLLGRVRAAGLVLISFGFVPVEHNLEQ